MALVRIDIYHLGSYQTWLLSHLAPIKLGTFQTYLLSHHVAFYNLTLITWHLSHRTYYLSNFVSTTLYIYLLITLSSNRTWILSYFSYLAFIKHTTYHFLNLALIALSTYHIILLDSFLIALDTYQILSNLATFHDSFSGFTSPQRFCGHSNRKCRNQSGQVKTLRRL